MNTSFRTLLQGTTLTAALASYYTVTGTVNSIALITGIKLCNFTATIRTITAEHVPAGAAAANRYIFLFQVPIPPGTTHFISFRDKEFIMNNGDSLQFLADVATSVNLFLYGGEIL